MAKKKGEEKKGLARRKFLKDTNIGVGGVTPWLPEKWDYEADVVVAGYGFGGVSAAIAAKDAGADVLVLEKAPTANGGNSGCSTGIIHTMIRVDDVEDFIRKIRYGSFGTIPDEELIRAIATDMQDTGPWLENMGVELMWSRWKERKQSPAGYMASFMKSDGTVGAGADLFAFLHGVTTSKNIPVMLSTPAKELIQDPATKEILGVVAAEGAQGYSGEGGRKIYIKAKKGVILACGGYESNPLMQGWFNNPGLYMFPWGTPYNTGDGLNMCYSVGASMWHFHGLEFATLGFRKASETVDCSVGTNATTGIVPYNYIFVNKYGKRFMNEAQTMGHYMGPNPLTEFDGVKLEYMNIPFFLIFDDTIMKAGPLSPRQARTGMWTSYNSVHARYVWSDDNSEELARGWIVKGDTISELATKMSAIDPSGNTVGVDQVGLTETVSKFNTYVQEEEDLDFARPPDKLAPVITSPYYAVEMSLACINTQGGPVRNKHYQTVGANGNPIPRLYSVGEFGSVNGFVYVAGNIAEALTTGRVAGQNAAKETPWGDGGFGR